MKRRGIGLGLWLLIACGGEATPSAPTPASPASPTTASPTTPTTPTASPTPTATPPTPEAAGEPTNEAPTDSVEGAAMSGVTALVASDGYTCVLVSRRLRCVGTPPSTLPDGEHDLVAALSGALCVATRDGDAVRCWGEGTEMTGYESASARWQSDCNGDLADECVEDREQQWAEERRRDGLTLPMAGVKALVGSNNLVCALGNEGRVSCWDLFAEVVRPLRQLTIAGAVELAIADGLVCARLEDGGARCWEEYGEPEARVRPTAVRNVEGAVRIAVGAGLSCAWNATGEARCWGFDWAYDRDLPERGSARVRDFDGFESFAFSGVDEFGCGLRNGRVECVGDPRFGHLGRAGVASDARPHVAYTPGFPAVPDPRRVVVGLHHACALDASEKLHCWGSSAEGALGAARKRSRFAPETVPGVRAEALAVIYQRTCARTTEGWRCWGPESPSDRRGEPWRVVPSDFPNESVPVVFAGRVCARFGESVRCPNETHEARAFTSGASCRLTVEGALECRQHQTWARAEGLSDLRWIAGTGTGLLVGKPGLVQRVQFQFGDGSFRLEALEAPPDIEDVLMVGSTACVRRTSTMSCHRNAGWVDLATPPLVEVGAGSGYACGRSAAGEVWCWGYNLAGQLGRETPTTSEAPVRVAELGVASALVVGPSHACAIVEEGAVRCWGASHEGQLGVDPGTWVPQPVMME